MKQLPINASTWMNFNKLLGSSDRWCTLEYRVWVMEILDDGANYMREFNKIAIPLAFINRLNFEHLEPKINEK